MAKQSTELAPPQAAELAFEKPIEREIGSGEKHVYRVNLSVGEFALFTIEQLGIDLEEQLFDLGGKVVADADTAPRNDGVDQISLVAMTEGDHRFELRPKFKGEKGKYRVTFSERRPSSERDKALFEADSIYMEFLRLNGAGKYTEALDAAERVLAIREKFSEPASGEVGIVLNRIGMLHYSRGNNLKGQEYLARTLRYYESNPPSEPMLLANTLNNVANTSYLRGDLNEAEGLYQRSLEIKERELGVNHNSVALTLANLGSLYRMRGDFPTAENAYLRSLEIRERVLGKDHPDLKNALLNLANVSVARGEYDSALAYDKRMVDILTKKLGPDHPETAAALSNLAKVYLEMGDFANAEPLLTKSLETMRKSLKEEHDAIVGGISNLALVHEGKGDFEAARSYYETSLKLAEKNAASLPLQLSVYLDRYGTFLLERGDLEIAEKHLRRAFQIREELLGDGNPTVGRTASLLARLYARKGDLRSALDFQARAIAAAEPNIELNLSTGTERQKLGYLEYLANDLSQAIAINAMLDKTNVAGRDLAVTAILQRKGRVLDAMANSTANLRQRSSPEVRVLFERLNDANALLSQLMIEGPKSAADTAYRERLEELRGQQTRYEAEISRQTSGSFQGTRSLSVEDVKRLLPQDSALVEFALFSRLEPSLAGEERYAAYILKKDEVTRWIDLGPRAAIDRMVDSLRRSMREQGRSDVRKLARDVDKAVMEPIRHLAGSPARFLLSTEGSLSLLPFEALVDENGLFLIERRSITYISSSRDLRRLDASNSGGSAPMVIANPDFGTTSTDTSASLRDKAVALRPDRSRSVTNTRNLADTYFAPLSGTEAEGRAIVEVFPRARLISGSGASETALKDVAAPEILHIATHGFFLEDPDSKPISRRGSETSAKSSGLMRDNPLLRSGLAFAGANLKTGAKD
ncbi:MAG: CHAT domain-containing protein, partial [bacterium]|nr:CHAT domain-containing protein [bacterium]